MSKLQNRDFPASHSYWETKQFYKNNDVIIIGAGIVGLSAALALKSKTPSLKVSILERGHLPSGASTKNAGFACFGSISELIEFQKRGTPQSLFELVKLRYDGLKLLRATVGDSALDFKQLGGFEIFRDGEEDIAEECCSQIHYYNELLKDAIGSSNIYHVATNKIADFGFHNINCIIENKFEGQIDTGKMMSALTAKVAGYGTQIHTDTAVTCLQRTDNGYRIDTNHAVYEAKKVILATNAFAKELFPALDVVPGRGQVLVTKPINNLKIQGTFHYQQGYYYFRNIDGRLLLGGGRNLNFKGEETYELGLTDQIQDSLIELIKSTILPGINFEIEQRWSGLMGFGSEIEPIIKKLDDNLFCAVRCNGMGVALGSISGARVAELALEGM